MKMLLLNFTIAGAVCWAALAMNATTDNDDEALDQAHRLQLKSTADLLNYLQNVWEVKHKVCPGSTLKPVHVYLTLIYYSVPSLNDATQTMTNNFWVLATWKDETLAWNASDFNGVDSVQLPDAFIWIPKIKAYNAVQFDGFLLDHAGWWPLIVYSNGTVLVNLEVGLETVCKLDLTHYPYDTQDCPMFIGTIQQVDTVILHQLHEPMIEYFSSLLKLSAEWDLLECLVGERNNHTDSVTFRLRRKSTFYTACLVLPMVLTSFMNTLVFLVPLQSGEKISFLVTIFVSTSVFVGFFNDVMPRGLDSMPVTMKLLVSVVVQSLLVLVATLVIMMIHANELDTETFSPQSFQSHRKNESHAMNDQPAVHKATIVFQNKVSQEKVDGDENVIKCRYPATSKFAFKITAKRLDLICFVIFLIVNVTTLVVLYLD